MLPSSGVKKTRRPACDSCGIAVAEYACAGCCTANYCAPACQVAHWKAGHGRDCAILAELKSALALAERPRDERVARRRVSGKRDGAGKEEEESGPSEKKRRTLEPVHPPSPPPGPAPPSAPPAAELTADGRAHACVILSALSVCPSVTPALLLHMHPKDVSALAATCSGFRDLLDAWSRDIDMGQQVLSDALSSFLRYEYPHPIGSITVRVETSEALLNVLNITTLWRLRLTVGKAALETRPITPLTALGADACSNLLDLVVNADSRLEAENFIVDVVGKAHRLRSLVCVNVDFRMITIPGAVGIKPENLQEARLIDCWGNVVVRTLLRVPTLQRLHLKMHALPQRVDPPSARRPLRELVVRENLDFWDYQTASSPRFFAVLAYFAPDRLELLLEGEHVDIEALEATSPLLSSLGDDPPLRELRVETTSLDMNTMLPDVFRRCKLLEKLVLARSEERELQIEASSFPVDAELPRLESFSAYNKPLRERGQYDFHYLPEKCDFAAALLRAAPALTRLHLPGMLLTDGDEDAIASSRSLTELNCGLGKASSGKCFWASAPRLETATLLVEDEHCLLSPYAREMPRLQRLDLRFYTERPVDASVPLLTRSACRALLRMTVVADGFVSGPKDFDAGQGPSKLDELRVVCTAEEGRESAHRFATSARDVREVRVSTMLERISLPDLFLLTAEHAPISADLMKLRVDSAISSEFLIALLTSCPNLRSLKLLNLRQEPAEFMAALDAAFKIYEARERTPRVELIVSREFSADVSRLRMRHPAVCFEASHHMPSQSL